MDPMSWTFLTTKGGGVVWCGVVWCGVGVVLVRRGVVLCCVVLCCVVLCCVVWCGVVWCVVAIRAIRAIRLPLRDAIRACGPSRCCNHQHSLVSGFVRHHQPHL